MTGVLSLTAFFSPGGFSTKENKGIYFTGAGESLTFIFYFVSESKGGAN